MDTLILVLNNINIPVEFFKKNIKWNGFRRNEYLCYSLTYKNIHLQYLSYCRGLILTVSVTKFLYGANFRVLNVSDLDKFCFEINFILKQIFNRSDSDINNPDLTNILEWKLSRLDLVANFTCGNDYQKKINLDMFKDAKYPYLKKNIFDTGIHDGNNCISLNFYDKNTHVKLKNNSKNLSLDENLLRCEVQIKKGGLNSLVKKGYLPEKKFKDIFYNIDTLNSIYANYLRKFGLFKKFLTDDQLRNFLLNLKNINEISTRECENMQLTLVDKNKCVSKNTLNKYTKILAKYNVSHITVEEHNILDFSNFILFKPDQLKRENNLNLLILIYLYHLNLLIMKTSYRTITMLSARLTRPPKLVEIYDDS